MNLIENKKIFYIDSRKRISGTDSDFLYKFDVSPDDEFDSCVILQMIIPKSYYLIREGYNFFSVEENNQSRTIIIPVGNYSRRSLAKVLQLLLNDGPFTYTITFTDTSTADTGKYLFTVSNNNNVQPKFLFSENVYESLGFNANSEYVFNNNILFSDNVIKLQLEDCIYLKSDICQNPEGNNVLQEIFCSTGDPNFSNIYYHMIDLESNSKDMIKSPNNIYRFRLTNENDQPINLNGLNMNLSLMMYKKNNLGRMLKGIIKYLLIKDD